MAAQRPSIKAGIRTRVRRAIEQAATESAVEQVILLGMNACGLPKTTAGRQ